ncbi:histidinol-phosphate phosphatase family domain-containing protein/HAD-superfamily hydrolase, subfamily IIIA [Mycolicibacterium rutilum]|uniref:D,D-heptose 1,7-bisphosphate phosphatase n=1 Tax=Mycolicibacterium rutilum TaxID=370526 RepID=A0A1H6M1L3_MYCRU|nr:HAD-IIIA family hydrolase [Mycolicibacterium rutilum]SEH91260.1 histidinol-phosphate phosphatase family domain-containing protein/HAD-superfamily hydrolase, subfamily IIIA [Mycolicibacterium rutilum]
MTPQFAVVVPTVGRPSLHRLLAELEGSAGPRPADVIVVDDRAATEPALSLECRLPVRVLRSGGRGPAAARNTGWRATTADWICFLDDDVVPQPNWFAALADDLAKAEVQAAAGSQAQIEVPRVGGRRATDDERRTQRLADAQWITADMAFRRDVLVAVGGFDDRFPRAYREDSDVALRITRAGNTIVRGARRCTHPVAQATLMSSVRAQVGNRDNALLRRKHGRRWRAQIGEGRGRLPLHAVTTATGVVAALGALTGRRQAARLAAALWALLTAEFAARRFWAGPHTAAEAGRMVLTSALIPPVAVAHRAAGEWTFRGARPDPPLAVLFDRDDTLIEDGPYLNDPAGVRPLPGAVDALNRLRRRGLLLAVVTNQSGVARGLISPDQLRAVNAAVEAALGPFDSWHVCLHDDTDGCRCRKPAPGMVVDAAAALGVHPSRCVLMGDTGGDVEAALAAGADAVLVPTRRTLRPEINRARAGARVASSIDEAVSLVLKDCR